MDRSNGIIVSQLCTDELYRSLTEGPAMSVVDCMTITDVVSSYFVEFYEEIVQLRGQLGY